MLVSLFARGLKNCCLIGGALVALLTIFGLPRAYAVDISDTPLETQLNDPAPNLIFILDDSGSMDWEFMTDQANGLFEGCFYLFPDSAYDPAPDHVYGAGHALNESQRRRWRTQWAGFNKLYFNPNSAYHPWPASQSRGFSPADPNRPWSNPANTSASGARLDMQATFFSINSHGSAIHIPNAHYFTIDDANGNGWLDPGEAIYLVAWKDTDGDGQFDLGSTMANDQRSFYRFQDDGDNLIEEGELNLVAEDSEKNRVRAVVLSENGQFERYKTDGEDLQNFANWFSYHRRRELAAKAAIAGAVSGLKEIYVGFYALNKGPRIEAQPVKLDHGSVVIVDNADAGFSASGDWYEAKGTPEWGGSSLYTEQAGGEAVFRPDLPLAGIYQVSAWWPCAADGDTSVRIEVSYAGGSQSAVVEKDQHEGGSDGCGRWVPLGAWEFTAGTDNAVRLLRSGQTGGTTSADALKFENSSGSGPSQDQTDFLLDQLYAVDSNGSTPLRHALDQVGRYFAQNLVSDLGGSPYQSEAKSGGCQRSYAVVMTDGYWNGEFAGVGNADGDKGSPYADRWSDTLADVAMYYYDTDLSANLPDQVPRKGCDHAAHQHLSTFTISFGVNGTLDVTDIDQDGRPDIPGYGLDPCFADAGSPQPVWPEPQANQPTVIDDLWHAAVNGRGQYFSTDNPQSLFDAVTQIVTDIGKTSSSATISASSDQLVTDSVIYQTRYNSDSWTGELLALIYNPDTGQIRSGQGLELWNAARQLDKPGVTYDSRRIVTYGGRMRLAQGIPFRYYQLSDRQKTALGSDLKPDSEADQKAREVLNFIRGRNSPTFRSRSGKLGDMVHSAPVLVGNTVFVGANDGMLHAFDSQSGDECFAYVPNLVFADLKALSASGYVDNHRFYVDATPYAGEVLVDIFKRSTYLVGGLGKGGKGYYCLLIGQRQRTRNGAQFGPYHETLSLDSFAAGTSEKDISRLVRWEYPRPDPADDGMDNNDNGLTDEAGEFDPDMGYSFGQGYAVNANCPVDSFRPVVIFGNGYNSPSGKAVLYILEADSGELVRKIDTGVAGDNGLSIPALIDVNLDRCVDYVYAGDLKGNLWKFDLTAADPAQWGLAYGEDLNGNGVIEAAQGDLPRPVFQARGQSITGRPDVMLAASTCASQAPGYMVIFGTGRYLGESDRADLTQQSIYGIWDFGDDSDDSEFLGYLTDRSAGTLSNGLQLVRQEIHHQTEPDGSVTRKLDIATVDFSTLDDSGDEDSIAANNQSDHQEPDPRQNAGWFIDFPLPPAPDADPGERVTGNVAIRGGKAVVVSFAPSTAPCSGGGNSWIYVLNGCLSSTIDSDETALQTIAWRIDSKISDSPLILKAEAQSQMDQILVNDDAGRILIHAFPGEVWGRVYWRQNIQ